MKSKSNSYKLSVYFILAVFVLLQNSARATGNPALVAQDDDVHFGVNASHNSQQGIQISDAECLRLLEKIEIDDDLREQAVDVVMSSNIIARNRILLACSAYYDDTKLLVRRIKRLLLEIGSEELKFKPSVEQGDIKLSPFMPARINELGKAEFNTLPLQRNWYLNLNNQWQITTLGDFIDLNGDGLMDFLISYHEDTPQGAFYRAEFFNNGDGKWVMESCESNINWPARFAPCQ